jgi:hypothetical protein
MFDTVVRGLGVVLTTLQRQQKIQEDLLKKQEEVKKYPFTRAPKPATAEFSDKTKVGPEESSATLRNF